MSLADCYYPFSVIQFLLTQNATEICQNAYSSIVLFQDFSFLNYLKYFLITCFLESFIYLVAAFYKKINFKTSFMQIFILNLATHPLVILVFPLIFQKMNGPLISYILIAELFAIYVEFLLLQYFFKYNRMTSLILSIAANLFSWTFGNWLQVQGLV